MNNHNQLLLTVAQTALRLGIQPKTLRNWMSNKNKKNPLPVLPVRLGKKPMFRSADLAFFVEGLAPSAAAPQASPTPTRRGPRPKAERILGKSGAKK